MLTTSHAFLSGFMKQAEKVRKRVEVLLHNKDGRVLVGQKYFGKPDPVWVFPGGGIDKGETPEAAGAREAFEEVGRSSSKIKKIDVPTTSLKKKKSLDYQHKFDRSLTTFVSGLANLQSKDLLGKGGDLLKNPKFRNIDFIIRALKKEVEKTPEIASMNKARIRAVQKLRSKI
jgi:8-oxo-dGTP pyrophosphatase MutT (NUDIX family)